jgi:hypothetical protein
MISIVRAPLPADGVMAFFVVRAKRSDANLALLIVMLGLVLILADAFTGNASGERIERQKEVLREEIIALLSFTDQSQEELNIHIQQVYGRTGLIGLELKQLRRLKRDIRNRINRSG